MGIYARYKRSPEGFRSLIELLEAAPAAKRAKMIEKGLEEDAEFTRHVLEYCLTFEDVMNLSDMELAEVLGHASGRLVGMALCTPEAPFADEVISKFIRNAPPAIVADMREVLDGPKPKPAEIGGARLKMIQLTRKAEREGHLKTKLIPFKKPDFS